jgi:hypothetical protein
MGSNSTTPVTETQRTALIAMNTPQFLRIIKTSTNRAFLYSVDGQNWVTYVAAEATNQTETFVGIGASVRDDNADAASHIAANVFHYEYTTGTATDFVPGKLVW